MLKSTGHQKALISSHLKEYRRILNQTINLAKKCHYNKLFQKSKCNIKQTWMHINKILSKNKYKLVSDTFRSGNKILSNSLDIANEFNKIFSSKGSELASKISKSKINSDIYLMRSPKVENTIFFNPTDENEIRKIVHNLKSKHSYGFETFKCSLSKN